MTTNLSAVLEEVEITDGLLSTKSVSKESIDLEPLIREIYAIKDDDTESITIKPSHLQVWRDIEDEFELKRTSVQEYKNSKNEIAGVPLSNVTPKVDIKI